MAKSSLSYLADKWPSGIVSREEIGTFTGGAISPKSIANLDCQGEGIDGALLIGRKVVYPVAAVIAWLENLTKLRPAAREV